MTYMHMSIIAVGSLVFLFYCRYLWLLITMHKHDIIIILFEPQYIQLNDPGRELRFAYATSRYIMHKKRKHEIMQLYDQSRLKPE